MRIACLHTAQVHVATFTNLFSDAAPDADVVHVVRADLLSDAQRNGAESVVEHVGDAIAALQDADAILCTCSTLGPLVDALDNPKAVRIDRPVMAAAAALGPKPMLAICLESTRDASLALLKEADPDMTPTVHLCDGAWAFFEAGDMDGFADTIAASVRKAAGGHDCVILGQASMRVAEPALHDLGIPVLTSPALAVAHTIKVAES